MAQKMYIMTDAIICSAIAYIEGMTIRDRVNRIDNYITQKVDPWERDTFADLVLRRIDRLREVKVE